MTEKVRQAIKEATIDTSIALPLNFIINWIVLVIAFKYNWGATYTTLVATAVFTLTAIIRKTYVRLHFERKANEKSV
jgi:ABC-type transport system involved in Fe-S cluster assembly fused permease/ATPase subunit